MLNVFFDSLRQKTKRRLLIDSNKWRFLYRKTYQSFLYLHKLVYAHTHFSDNRTNRPFANVLATMMRNRHNATIGIANLQLMRTFAMSIKTKSQFTQTPCELLIAQFSEFGHLILSPQEERPSCAYLPLA